MGTDIAVCQKGATESDTKWSYLLFHPCSLHPWLLEPQELVTMVQQLWLVLPNKLPRQHPVQDRVCHLVGHRVPREGGAGLCDRVREAMHPENPATLPADHQTGMPHRVRETMQHHLQERLCSEDEDSLRALYGV